MIAVREAGDRAGVGEHTGHAVDDVGGRSAHVRGDHCEPGTERLDDGQAELLLGGGRDVHAARCDEAREARRGRGEDVGDDLVRLMAEEHGTGAPPLLGVAEDVVEVAEDAEFVGRRLLQAAADDQQVRRRAQLGAPHPCTRQAVHALGRVEPTDAHGEREPTAFDGELFDRSPQRFELWRCWVRREPRRGGRRGPG